MPILHGDELTPGTTLRADVVIIGSGAGGGVLAEGLASAGLSLVILESGPFRHRPDFDMQETTAYRELYQERAGRATADQAITVLQGRTAGGGTTVNWTTCFRTPAEVLAHWREVHGIDAFDEETLRPHFEAMERRLSIHEWQMPPNNNNQVLERGCEALGWRHQRLRRNVHQCANSGYCGLGCPTGAKQSQIRTGLHTALTHEARLVCCVEARQLETRGGRVTGVLCQAMDRSTREVLGPIRVEAPLVALCGGAINSPALLLRSGLDNGRVGRRTFLHPVVGVAGRFPEAIHGWYGAPQSVGSHEHIDRGPDKVGFFLECAPVQPGLSGGSIPLLGAEMNAQMLSLSHMAVGLGLLKDGFHGDEGGRVTLERSGRPRLDYPLGPLHREALRAATVALCEVMLAAGAEEVGTLHPRPVKVRTRADLPAVRRAPYGALQHAIFSAHQMGGCAMGPDPARSVVDQNLRHHELENLFIVDGSVLPTSLGVNPSETIYALAHRARAEVLAAAG